MFLNIKKNIISDNFSFVSSLGSCLNQGEGLPIVPILGEVDCIGADLEYSIFIAQVPTELLHSTTPSGQPFSACFRASRNCYFAPTQWQNMESSVRLPKFPACLNPPRSHVSLKMSLLPLGSVEEIHTDQHYAVNLLEILTSTMAQPSDLEYCVLFLSFTNNCVHISSLPFSPAYPHERQESFTLMQLPVYSISLFQESQNLRFKCRKIILYLWFTIHIPSRRQLKHNGLKQK